MKVEIWSDVVCPFCYIGKRHFEQALKQFPQAEQVEITWRSYQLDPEAKTDPTKSVYESLAQKKGWTVDYAKQVSSQVVQMAKNAGLDYHFEKAVTANTFKAHRLSHLAKQHNLADAMEERLFKAYFINGENIDDEATLLRIAEEIGLDKEAVNKVLSSDQFSREVISDIEMAGQIGVRGVPFFVIDRKYAVSGAQPAEVFAGALQKAWDEMPPEQKITSANSCSTDGDCC